MGSSTAKFLKIQDYHDVNEFIDLMTREDGGGYSTIYFSYAYSDSQWVLHPTFAKEEVGDAGDVAVKTYIARSLATAKARVHVSFNCCNLSRESVDMLADALEKNESLVGFTCVQNPCNFRNRVYYPKSDDRMAQAVSRTKAPLASWNGYPIIEEKEKEKEKKSLYS